MKMRTVAKIVAKVIISLVVVFVLGIAVYSIIARAVKGDNMPMPFGVGATIILSGSMEPNLAVDDVAVIKKCNQYDVGDVVVFKNGNSYTIHRIIELNGNEVITKGDANNAQDDPITLDKIKGKMVFSIPKVGVVVYFVRSPWFFPTVAGLILGIVAISILCKKKKNNKCTNKVGNQTSES